MMKPICIEVAAVENPDIIFFFAPRTCKLQAGILHRASRLPAALINLAATAAPTIADRSSFDRGFPMVVDAVTETTMMVADGRNPARSMRR
ncbi:hypothetical protein GOP47_0026517 [Adiantum capillus-veneris]|nr:hypothetical protein GOP47_0026517 [Adiantum capillus-veneris]